MEKEKRDAATARVRDFYDGPADTIYRQEAKEKGCEALHLDSGVQRAQTHRFYFREGLTINAYHFRIPL